MKLSSILVIGAAGLATASPLSVVVSTSDFSAYRLGHPAAPAVPIPQVDAAQPATAPTRMRHACKHMQKTVQDGIARMMSAMGLAAHSEAPSSAPAPPRIVVHHFQPVPVPVMVEAHRQGADRAEGGRRIVMHHHMTAQRESFMMRANRAMMALGPWEGRVVAFVLGCGIGVLLRMVFILSVVLYRAVRGRSANAERDEAVFDGVLFLDAEEVVVPPPQYTDEKVAAAGAEDHATEVETRA